LIYKLAAVYFGDAVYIPLYLKVGIVNKFFIAYLPVLRYKSYMPSEKPKILFVIDNELLEKLKDYRFENRINSMSEAIRQLLEMGLAAARKKSVKESANKDKLL
jgi:hypothetical protein